MTLSRFAAPARPRKRLAETDGRTRAAEPVVPLTAAQQALAADHLDLAIVLARTYTRRHGLKRLYAEIESAALYGLCQAAAQYDPARACLFRTFAPRRILGEIRDTLRFALPKGFKRTTGPAPAVGSLSARVGPSRPGRGPELHDALESGADPVGWELDSHDAVVGLTARLGPTRAAMLRDYFLRGRTMKAIGADLGCSEGRVSQLIGDTLADLRGRLDPEVARD